MVEVAQLEVAHPTRLVQPRLLVRRVLCDCHKIRQVVNKTLRRKLQVVFGLGQKDWSPGVLERYIV